MKELNRRFEMVISEEQSEKWSELAKSQNLTKAELVRRTMKSYLEGKTTQKDWEIYQKLGELIEELKEKKEQGFIEAGKTINEVINRVEQLRLEVILNHQQLRKLENRKLSRS
jgi:hypothetical protein